MKKILIRMAMVFVLFILFSAGATFLFVTFSPQFGGTATPQQKLEYAKRAHYKDGIFHNLIETTMDMSGSKGLNVLWKFIKGVPNARPDFNLPVEKVDSINVVENKNHPRVIWFGHSAFLVQMGGKTLLLDPMLTSVPAPHPTLGGKRFAKELPIEIAQIPKIDAILISHDHYDHLDYESIQQLKTKTSAFYVPLGVGAHFRAWGVADAQIHEMAWWEETQMENLQIAFAPARHFSGRGLTNRNTTLWGSWIISADTTNIYFSGDGGYGPHFKEIGEKYGPFDFAMLECGQYNENWAQIHMMPEETVQAAIDVKARRMMPIHWGAFALALHKWTDPIERVTKRARELNVPLIAPKIGQEVWLHNSSYAQEIWWVNAK